MISSIAGCHVSSDFGAQMMPHGKHVKWKLEHDWQTLKIAVSFCVSSIANWNQVIEWLHHIDLMRKEEAA